MLQANSNKAKSTSDDVPNEIHKMRKCTKNYSHQTIENKTIGLELLFKNFCLIASISEFAGIVK